MREFFTDKNYIVSKLVLAAKIILVVALLAFFVPLCILSFFNHPCADDYICGYRINSMGFWPYQFFIYNDWGGRFASIFAGSLFARNNYLYDHYYLHSLLLVSINIFSAWFMVALCGKYILRRRAADLAALPAALLYVAWQFSSLAEPGTYIFWFSSAVTYQLPVVLLQLQAGLWIVVFYNKHLSVIIPACILIVLLVPFINGCNELFIVAQIFLFFLLLLCGAYKKLPKAFLFTVLAVYAASAFFVLLAPGIQSRTAIIEPKGIWVGTAALGFHVAETLWNICRNPFTWLAVILTYLYGSVSKDKFRQLPFMAIVRRRRWLLPILIAAFLVMSIAAAVAGLKGGIIPERYVNGVICITIPLGLVLAFAEGVLAKRVAVSLFTPPATLIILLLCITALLANEYVKDVYRNLVAAPLYDSVMDEREATLKQASPQHKTIVVKSYDTSMQEYLRQNYGNSGQTLYNLVQQKPSFLFFEDDLATEYAKSILQNFYGADSISVK